jgi:hypothetical protein
MNATRPEKDKTKLMKKKLFDNLKRFKVFSLDVPEDLQNIASKDRTTKNIEENLLTAREKGQEQVKTFVRERLVPCEERKVKFRDALPKNKPLTFASLYEVKQKDAKNGKQTTVKTDRKILQRLITAYEAGRSIDLSVIMKHELMPVPPLLAETDGSLRSGSKASLLKILTSGVNCPPGIEAHELGDKATLVVDGQAHVCALGKPQGAATFGDLADTFVKSLLAQGHAFKRIDIVFDRYDQLSIKGGTRKKRSKGAQPIRKLIV